ncbi:MAG: hypothetical protein WCO30_00265 [bacterium]
MSNDVIYHPTQLPQKIADVTNHLIRRFHLAEIWKEEMECPRETTNHNDSYESRRYNFTVRVLSMLQSNYVYGLRGARVGELLEYADGNRIKLNIPVHHLHLIYLKPAMNDRNDLENLHKVQQLLLATFLTIIIQNRFDKTSSLEPKYVSVKS